MNQFTELDFHYMQLALTLAERGRYTTSPNPMVGCVIVKDAKVVGQGFHQKAGQGHAEVHALAQAGENAQGATAYVTLEPCSHFGRTPPCAQALIKAKIATVYVAMTDPNPLVSGKGIAMLQQAGIAVYSGLLTQAAEALNVGFINRMRYQRPYVQVKLAASLDGKTALANGDSQWITSSAARQDVQRYRAKSCAILTGADTVLMDNAKMTVRWSELGSLAEQYPENTLRQPLRVIIDSKNRLSPGLALFQQTSPILIIRQTLDKTYQWPDFVEQVCLPMVKSHIDLLALLHYLAEHKQINYLWVEAGATLAGVVIEQQLADELLLYQAPILLGHDAKSLVTMKALQSLNDALTLNITDSRMVGRDIRISARINRLS